MLSVARYVLVLLVTSYSITLTCHAQTPLKQATKGGVIAGTVTIKGKPAADIMIGARANTPVPTDRILTAKTDQEGKYRITGLSSGVYIIAPMAPGFVITNKDRSAGETLTVVGSETIPDINFELVRGGVITGRVVDADGRPVIEQQISVISADPSRPVQLNFAQQMQTDDRGVYRIFGIAAGQYKVGVGLGDDRHSPDARRNSYKQSFYADSVDVSNADVIEVGEGSEVSNINITIRSVQMFAISGRVVDGEGGRPVAGAKFGLQIVTGGQTHSSGGGLMTSNSQGDFKLENLRPGNYGIFIMPEPGSTLRSEVVPFEIAGEDVNGLVVKTSRATATMSGVLIIENSTDKAVWASLLQLRLYGYVQKDGSRASANTWTTINPDGSFSLSGLDSGKAYLSLSGSDRLTNKGFHISRLERNGAVESRGIEIKDGDQVTGVRVLVTYGNATVQGIVKFGNGPLPAGARAYVRLIKDGANSRSPQADTRGAFILGGLPGGTYELEATVYIPTRSGAMLRAKQQLTLTDGAITDVVINVENPDQRLP